jgi:hypothetical protein
MFVHIQPVVRLDTEHWLTVAQPAHLAQSAPREPPVRMETTLVPPVPQINGVMRVRARVNLARPGMATPPMRHMRVNRVVQ